MWLTSFFQNDALFATSTRGLKLDQGTLSKCVLEAAGPSLQAECSTKYPQGIQHGEVAELAPGQSGFKKIILCSIPRLGKHAYGGKDPAEVLYLSSSLLDQI